MTDFGDKEEGWQNWLMKYKLWDENLTEDQAYLRYMKFKKTTFQCVPEEEWYKYFWELLLYEPALVFGDAIGLCEEFPFDFEVSNDEPLIMKPMPFPKDQRDWIREHMEQQCQLGVMRKIIKGKEPDPKFVTNVVLVAGGQSQTEYRLCGNFVQPNMRIKPPAHPMIDCRACLDSLQGCKIVSGIDIKAAFQNIWVPKKLQTYLGIVTQDGLFVYTRMPFGILAAPAAFQFIITMLLDRNNLTPRPSHSTYLDDVMVGNRQGREATWEDTNHALHRLTHGGLPINIWKCDFLAKSITALGILLWDSQITLGFKAMQKFFGTELPTNLRELQGLMGRLNFASQFIPNYRKRIQPFLSLMSKYGDGKWTQNHTDCLNELAQTIHSRIRLGLCDMNKPIKVHVDADHEHCSSVITQGEGEEYKVIAFQGRPLTPTEARTPRLERLLITANWAMKKMGRYTQYVPQVCIVLPHPCEVVVAQKTDLPVRLQAQIVELSSYGCKFECGVGAWGLQNNLLKEGGLQLVDPLVHQAHPPPDAKIWEHQDITLDMPNSQPLQQAVDIANAHVMHYDGGCSHKKGSGGYVLWAPNGQCLGGQYKYYGDARPTCNQAEAQALLDGLKWVSTQFPQLKYVKLIARGDSNLVTQFMQKRAKPGQPKLVSTINDSRKVCQQFSKVYFQHVPRENNKWADWLTRVAGQKLMDGDIVQPSQVQGDPPQTFQPAFISYLGDKEEVNTLPCSKCKQDCSIHPLECWGCGRNFHTQCVGNNLKLYPGPWHCKVCILAHKFKGTRDITLDQVLMRYLAVGEKPKDPTQLGRVLRATRFMEIDSKGQLWLKNSKLEYYQVIPMKDRVQLIQNTAQSFAYPSGRKIYELLKQSVYWQGMLTDCLAICADSLPHQKEMVNFKKARWCFPTEKGAAPFSIWCIDTIVNLCPAAPDGAKDMLVAVDPFTKWVECGPIPHLNSHEVAQWFHREVVCRYGLPAVVRSDRGTEYKGEFDEYLQGQGIQHRFIATMNPRANGQVERMIRTIKGGLRKILAAVPDCKWWEVFPDVIRGMRCLPNRATGYSPHLLVFKTAPILPIANALSEVTIEEIDDMGVDMEHVVSYWQKVYEEVANRQKAYDSKMAEAYMRQRTLAEHDVRYIFNPGDKVLLKQTQPAKHKCRAVGPYIFVRYTGELGVNAYIVGKNNKEYMVSAGNLLPVHEGSSSRLQRYQVPTDQEIQQEREEWQKKRTGAQLGQSPKTPVVIDMKGMLKTFQSIIYNRAGPSQFDSDNDSDMISD